MKTTIYAVVIVVEHDGHFDDVLIKDRHGNKSALYLSEAIANEHRDEMQELFPHEIYKVVSSSTHYG